MSLPSLFATHSLFYVDSEDILFLLAVDYYLYHRRQAVMLVNHHKLYCFSQHGFILSDGTNITKESLYHAQNQNEFIFIPCFGLYKYDFRCVYL